MRSVAYAASNSVVKASRRAKSTLASLAPEPLRQSTPVADSTASTTGGSAGGGRASALPRGHGRSQSADNISGSERTDGGSRAGSSGGGGELVPYGIRVSGGGGGGDDNRRRAASGDRDLLLVGCYSVGLRCGPRIPLTR